jgi:S1-C subfamily serine protease
MNASGRSGVIKMQEEQAQGQPGHGEPGYAPPGYYGQPGYPPAGQGYGPPGYGTYGYPQAGYGPGGPRRRHSLVYLLVAVLAAGVGAGAVLALHHPSTAAGSNDHVSAQQIPAPHRNADSGTSSTRLNEQSVASKVTPGLVDIDSTLAYQNTPTAGTGMVLSSNGLVLTNNHVVEQETDIRATVISTGHTYRTKVLGVDPSADVALIQLQGASGLKTVQVGNSAGVTLGTPFAAIGNAGGTGGQPTVTNGSITALDRTISASDQGSGTNSETLHGMLQGNAPIAEGDSGGAWANAAGQVIGMTTAANTQSLGGAGTDQGFAVPINKALRIARQIAAGHGSSTIILGGGSGFIGIGVANIGQASSCLASNGFGYRPPVSTGALVCSAFAGTPAAKAGLTSGDVITAVNNQPVASANALTKVMRNYRPGATISLTWVDTNGQKHTSTVTLIQGPPK